MINIEVAYVDLKVIYEEFGEDRVIGTFNSLFKEMMDFIDSNKINGLVYPDQAILSHTVLDYYCDISRLKHFHKIDIPNSLKKMAYESYWLLRRKPLQQNYHEISDDKWAFVNEKFVFSRIAKYLIDDSGVDEFSEDESAKKFKNYLDTFYYYLKYRQCDPQMFEIMIMGFQAGSLLGQQKGNIAKK